MTTGPDDPRVSGLCRALGLGGDPQAVLTELGDVYRDVDAAVAGGVEGLELPCRPGCDACCHEAVFLSAPEFFAVAERLLRTMPLERRRRIVEDMRALARRFEDELLLLEELSAGPERDEVALRIRFRCPLLGADGRCTVYPVRELNARTFGMTRDEGRGSPFGCSLTHRSLRVLPDDRTSRLMGARSARLWLMERVRGTGAVRVYPWWFARFGHWLLESGVG